MRFFDMTHSNNAARIRLYFSLKQIVTDRVLPQMIKYDDLSTDAYGKVNPLKKVPALIRSDGTRVFEASVILSYLDDEDMFAPLSPRLTPLTAEGRQEMELIIRCHDLYVASPNCTAPGFSHNQGAMYLSCAWHGTARGMDLPTRAAKTRELWKQLSWLESVTDDRPYLAGDNLSLADLTWFPTAVFMDYLLPRSLGWDPVFVPAGDEAASPFPKIARWYSRLREREPFAGVHAGIWSHWIKADAAGQLTPIRDEIAADQTGLKFRYP
jgi:glutathione S-transferase